MVHRRCRIDFPRVFARGLHSCFLYRNCCVFPQCCAVTLSLLLCRLLRCADAANASWVLVPASIDPSNGISIQSLTTDPSLFGFFISVGTVLNGPCADNFEAPAGSAVLTDGTNGVRATWYPIQPPPSVCANPDINTCRSVYFDDGGNSWSFDLCQLCRDPGSEYSWTDTLNHTFYYNFGAPVVGLNDSLRCTPPWHVYQSHGLFTQFWTDAPVCPTPSCVDPDTQKAVCCTGDCFVLGGGEVAGVGGTPLAPMPLSLIDASNPATGGISMQYAGLSNPADPFQCANNPKTGCVTVRTVTMNVYCDPEGSPTSDPTFLGISEPTQCQYLLELKHKLACGVQVHLTSTSPSSDLEL